MSQYFHPLPDLDQGWTQCPTLDVVLYQVLRVSEQVLPCCSTFKLAVNRSVVTVVINLHCAHSVCLYSMDFVSVTKP